MGPGHNYFAHWSLFDCLCHQSKADEILNFEHAWDLQWGNIPCHNTNAHFLYRLHHKSSIRKTIRNRSERENWVVYHCSDLFVYCDQYGLYTPWYFEWNLCYYQEKTLGTKNACTQRLCWGCKQFRPHFYCKLHFLTSCTLADST